MEHATPCHMYIEIGVAVTLSNIFQSYTTIYMEKQAYK